MIIGTTLIFLGILLFACNSYSSALNMALGGALFHFGWIQIGIGILLLINGLVKPERRKSLSIPEELNKWNWGGFFGTWIWGMGNRSPIAVLALIPYLDFILMFFLGFRGSTIAWRNMNWDSIEEFQRIQKLWAWVGLCIFLIKVSFAVTFFSSRLF